CRGLAREGWHHAGRWRLRPLRLSRRTTDRNASEGVRRRRVGATPSMRSGGGSALTQATFRAGSRGGRPEVTEGSFMAQVTVVGGGLSGSEAAHQLAERGHEVTLYEMRPVRGTPAHQTEHLAEVVCTNSFKSLDPANAHGLLKTEMRALGSLLLRCAEES